MNPAIITNFNEDGTFFFQNANSTVIAVISKCLKEVEEGKDFGRVGSPEELSFQSWYVCKFDADYYRARPVRLEGDGNVRKFWKLTGIIFKILFFRF